jgi:hypothetical protein
MVKYFAIFSHNFSIALIAPFRTFFMTQEKKVFSFVASRYAERRGTDSIELAVGVKRRWSDFIQRESGKARF